MSTTILENVNTLLQNKYEINIKYGSYIEVFNTPTEEGQPNPADEDIFICLETGSDKDPLHFLGMSSSVDYPLIIITACSKEYLSGYTLAKCITEYVKSATASVDFYDVIKQKGSIDSKYDKDYSRHIFTIKFKEIKLKGECICTQEQQQN